MHTYLTLMLLVMLVMLAGGGRLGENCGSIFIR